MKTKEMKEVASKLLKNKYMLLVLLLIGILLILLPAGSDEEETVKTSSELEAPSFSLIEEEARLKDTLAQIRGAGKVKVLLSLKSTATRELAESEDEAIIISAGSGTQKAVEQRYVYPEYMGAVVICEGASSARVRLDITQAVAAFTGLSSSDIKVIEMNN